MSEKIEFVNGVISTDRLLMKKFMGWGQQGEELFTQGPGIKSGSFPFRILTSF